MFSGVCSKINEIKCRKEEEKPSAGKSIKNRIAEMAGLKADENIMTFMNVACNER